LQVWRLARWKLGQLLAKVKRGTSGPKIVSLAGTQFRDYLHEIGLNKNRANECERQRRALVVPSRDNGLSRLAWQGP
jgi:hypothetical protein